MAFDPIFQPLKFKNLTIKNRILRSNISGRFDNYNGSWGPQEHLDRFLQMYAVEKAGLEARKKGYSVSEQSLEDGSIRLQIVEAR